MEEKTKRVVVPNTNICHDEGDGGFHIEVDLAGVPKETVELEMGTGGFCVKGEREDIRYESCYMLAHEVKPDEAKARFEEGLLMIHVPFKGSTRGHRVSIE